MNTVLSIVNIIALLIIPIVSVVVAQYLQDRAAKRRDKMAIFQCLMTHRATGWANQDTVNALNTIDIVFSDDKEVRACWASLLSKYKPNFSVQEVNTAQCKLLEAMAKALGYRDKITWEIIQNPYFPERLKQRMETVARLEMGQLAMADFATVMTSNPGIWWNNTPPVPAAKQEDKNNADA